MAVRAANTIEQVAKIVTKEVDRESCRAAESQGGTTITVGAVTPRAISASPESGSESSAPLLPSLDDLPTLREMLGLPDRESSPEEVDDDDNNGLERLFWIPPGVESPPSGLRPSSPAPKPPPPASEPVSSASAPEPVSFVSAPEPVSSASAPRACVPCFRPRACVLCLPPRACVLCLRPSLCPLPPPQSLRSPPLSLPQSLGAPSAQCLSRASMLF
jgi:hypothetical protein